MTQALTELLRGKGAHVDPIACVEDVPAELATRRLAGFPHSIADLVFHMNYWMAYELKRIQGKKPKYPDHASESFPFTPQDWDHLRRDFSWFLSEYAKSNPPAKRTNNELALWKPSSGKWSPTPATTLAKSPPSAKP